MALITPAILPSSREDFEKKLALFCSLPSVDRVQIDVVDGRFATPASWPYTEEAEFEGMVAKREMLPEQHRIAYEIDLMCTDAERAAGQCLTLGASRLTIHAVSAIDLERFLASVRTRYGDDIISIGLALNVTSDLALIESALAHIRIAYVQFMGIATIGRQGQPFDRRMLEKMHLFHDRHPDIPLQVDGGVSLSNARELITHGASHLVVGSALLRAAHPEAEIEKFEAFSPTFGV
jgi:ribulose-phosphate 3-epimerase